MTKQWASRAGALLTGVLSGILFLMLNHAGSAGLSLPALSGKAFAAEPVRPKPGGRILRSDQSLLRVAREDYRSQHDRMAGKALEELLASHPRSILRGPAILLLARIAARESMQSKSRNFRAPLEFFRKAEAVSPEGWDKGEIRFRMGQYLIRRRFGVEGRGLLDQVVSRYPSGPWAFRSKLLMADSLRGEGHLAQAENILKEIDPENGSGSIPSGRSKEQSLRFGYVMGHLLMDEGRYEEAQGFFVSSLNLSSSYPYRHPGTLFLLARYAYSMNHNRRAAALFRTFLRFYPDDERASDSEYYLGRISGRMGHPSHEQARLRAVIADNPGTTGSHLAQLQLIRMTFFSGKITPAPLPESRDRAVERLARLESEERNKRIAGGAALLRVRLLEKGGKLREAQRILSRLEGNTDLSGPFGKRLLAEEQKILMERLSALSHPLQASGMLAFYRSYRYRLPDFSSPGGGKLSLLLAEAHWKKGERSRAFLSLDRALENHYDETARREAALLRFDWMESSQRNGPALDWARKILSERTLSPQERSLWFSRAVGLAQKKGDTRSERILLGEWLSSGVSVGDRSTLQARLGLLDLSQGQQDQGERVLVRSLPALRESSGKNALLPEALFHLGQLSWSRGDKAMAQEYWKELLECCPSDQRNPWVLYQMGNMALGAGDRTGALEWFRRAEKASGGKEIGKVAQLRIESMGLEKKGGKQ